MRTTASSMDPRAAVKLLGFSLLAAWWLAYFPLPFLEFYKEWVFVTGLAVAALLGLRPVPLRDVARHPLFLGAAALAVVAVLQAALRPEHAPRVALYLGYLGLFLVALCSGVGMRRQFGGRATVFLAGTMLIGVVGCVFFAALQLNFIEFDWPFVAGRTRRVTANLAQANHLANLLWLGALAAAYLAVKRVVEPWAVGLVLLLVLVFVHLTGSRMPWLYAMVTLCLGLLAWLRGSQPAVKKLGPWLVGMALGFAGLAPVLSLAGVADFFGMSSGGTRLSQTGHGSSDSKRLWYWHVALDAASQEPWLGVGAGRYVGHGLEMSMADERSPEQGATSHAHNISLQLAAEFGIPAALAVTAAVGFWLFQALRRSRHSPEALFAAACGCVLLIHSMLEFPFWYAYFLGLFGLIAGLAAEPENDPSPAVWREQRVLPVMLLAGAIAAHALVRPLENAMQIVMLQVGVGGAPQPAPGIRNALLKVPPWSPYGDWAEALDLMTALPTLETAEGLAVRCDRALHFAPSPYVLARCATVHQVAGDEKRASQLANALCKLFPASDLTLIQSMEFVQRVSPAAGYIVSDCVERLD